MSVEEPTLSETDYYHELKEEKSKIDNGLRKVFSLIDRELERLENNIPEEEVLKFIDATKDKPIKLKERIMIPIKEFPKFNFVGKILGPKGNTLKRLQEQTACRMAVLGRGSVRSKEEEEKLLATGDPKYNHLRSDLHVCIEVFAPPIEAYGKMAHAISIIKPFLIPSDFNDDIRNSQFEELAMMGGGSAGPRMPGASPWKSPGAKKMRTSMGSMPSKRMPSSMSAPMGTNFGMPEMDYGYEGFGAMANAYSNGSSYGAAPFGDRYGMGPVRPSMSTDYNHLSGDYYGSGDMSNPQANNYNSPSMPTNNNNQQPNRGGGGVKIGGRGRGRGGTGAGRPTW